VLMHLQKVACKNKLNATEGNLRALANVANVKVKPVQELGLQRVSKQHAQPASNVTWKTCLYHRNLVEYKNLQVDKLKRMSHVKSEQRTRILFQKLLRDQMRSK
jgi:hypothetical protein